MTKILIGLYLVTLVLPIPIGEMAIDILPDFAGFFLIMFGLREIGHENDFFHKNIRFTFWVGVMSAMVFVMDIVSMVTTHFLGSAVAAINFQSLLMQLVVMVLEPICLLRIVRGVRQVEKDYEIDAKGKVMFILWVLMTLLSVAAFCFSGVPELGNAVGLILSFVSIGFAAMFYHFKSVYTELMEELHPEGEEAEEEAY